MTRFGVPSTLIALMGLLGVIGNTQAQIRNQIDPALLRTSDPEARTDINGVIRHWGYPVEEHEVQTDDGYILKIHRIPHGKNEDPNGLKKPVVFLQHGLLMSSASWVTNLPHQSFGFILADEGYDVWMGNFRGNRYSRRHRSLNPFFTTFWKFSWDQMALKDLPAMFDYVLSHTGQDQLAYTGHSMGTMTFLALCSEQPEYCSRKVSHFFALGPVSSLGNVRGAVRFVAFFTDTIDLLFTIIGFKELYIPDLLQSAIARHVCGNAFVNPLCTNILFLIGGADSMQTNSSRIPVIFHHTPAGTSSQNMIHFGQMVIDGQFRKYDHGYFGNLYAYRQTTPPRYDLTRMDVPTYLYYGDNDPLATTKDVEEELMPKLRNLKQANRFPLLNHMDFMWGLRAHNELYEPIMDVLRATKKANID